jgi:hypothetical protein
VSDADKPGSHAALVAELAARAEEADPAEVGAADARLEELLEKVDATPSVAVPSTAPAPAVDPSAALAAVPMRTAQPLAIDRGLVLLRAGSTEAAAELAPHVSPEVVSLAIANGDAVLVECPPGETPRVVGVLQTRVPDQIVLRARAIQLDAEEEVLVRSGRAALRVRKDGDVELVGSRISAMSRGLFRLVGRMLRLN